MYIDIYTYIYTYIYIYTHIYIYIHILGALLSDFVVRVHQMFASKSTFSPRLFRFLGIDFEKVQSEEVYLYLYIYIYIAIMIICIYGFAYLYIIIGYFGF
jgi:hypothetical protein